MYLSIIIPVYNVEKYLEKCIESILRQKLIDYEIILVDDGSTDGSGKICDQYAKINNKISVIHKKNGGLSDARNVGIKKAKGKYLMFVDSDDFLNDNINVKKNIYNHDEDIVQYKMMYYYERKKKYFPLKNIDYLKNYSFKENLLNEIKSGTLSVSACDKIVKKDLIVDNNLFFQKGLLSEDVDWSLRLYLYVKTIDVINADIYIYRQGRKGSITNNVMNKNILSLYKIIDYWYNYEYPDENFKIIYYNYLAYCYIILLTIINRKNCDVTLKKEINKYKFLLIYSENYKVRLCNKVFKVFGYNFGVIILRTYLFLKNKGVLKI